jgi:hypothetical protein
MIGIVSYMRAVYWTVLSITQTAQRRMFLWLVNNELTRIWKELTITWFEILSQNLFGGTEEIHKENLLG